MAAIVGVAALVIPLFAPGRDGQQLRSVRRLTGLWNLTQESAGTPG